MNLDAELDDIIRARVVAWPDIVPVLRTDGPFTYFIPAIRLGMPGLFIRVCLPGDAAIGEMAELASRGYAIAAVADGQQLRDVIDTYMMLEAADARQ